MTECGLSLGGYRSAGLGRAFCDEALNRPGPLQILVASEGSRILGFLIVLQGAWSYWRRFLFHHPVLALKMAIFTYLNHRLRCSRTPESSDGAPRLWHSEDPRSLRVLMIAVAPDFRRQNIGRRLYQQFFHLRDGETGAVITALIAPENQDSLAFHRNTGWTVDVEDDCFLATRVLGGQEEFSIAID